jgi:TonB-dependent SusC/RagA subfamily outer membrane receptor
MRYLAIVAALGLGCSHQHAAGKSEPATPPPAAAPKTVTADEPARQGVKSIEQMLAGRISGVTVSPAPGGGIVVQFVGPTSFYAGQEPLFVIDGAQVEVQRGTLTWLSAHDVESITALKGADTAIFGVRGSNGVIVIKTKGSH